MAQPVLPEWIAVLKQHDPEFADTYIAQRKRTFSDGAIPAKYKWLMAMLVDALAGHADGVNSLADRARAAGATEDEITETVEVAYLFGGTPAVVTATRAFR